LIGRIQDRATFAALRAHGLRARHGPLTITFLAAPADAAGTAGTADGSGVTAPRVRVAFAIGTRVGSAVVRNRCRRRLRAVFTEVDPAALPAGAYLVSVHPEVTALTYQELREHVERALNKIDARGRR